MGRDLFVEEPNQAIFLKIIYDEISHDHMKVYKTSLSIKHRYLSSCISTLFITIMMFQLSSNIPNHLPNDDIF